MVIDYDMNDIPHSQCTHMLTQLTSICNEQLLYIKTKPVI